MKRIISLITAVAILALSFSFGASALTEKGNEYPVILVIGRGAYTPYYGDDGEQIFPISVSTDELIEKVRVCLPYLASGLLSGDLEPWAKKVGEVIKPIYSDLIPDKNGKLNGGPKVINGYGHPLTTGSSVYDYTFNYDWRKDTLESAASLNEYINQIKEMKKCEKVSLVGRCYGSNVIAAYLYKYGHGDIDTAVFYCSTALGCYASSCLFSGEIKVTPEGIESFLGGASLFGEPVIDEFLRSTVSLMNTFDGIAPLTDFVNNFIKKVFPVLAPEIFPISYGAMPCFWNMVDNGRYEKAKKLIYNGREAEYSDFIEKTDFYHYNVAANLPEMLKKYMSEGLNVGVVAKYGDDALYPIYDNGNPQSDNTVELNLSSFGTSFSEYGKTFSKSYLKTADRSFISSDLCVDSSTAVFRDSTWYIKSAPHSTFPVSVDELIAEICNFDGQMTVRDNENYSRFMKYDADTKKISLLTDEPEAEKGFIFNIMEKLKKFLLSTIDVLKSVFKIQ